MSFVVVTTSSEPPGSKQSPRTPAMRAIGSGPAPVPAVPPAGTR